MYARRATVDIEYNSKKINDFFSAENELDDTISYTDNATKTIDDIAFTFRDTSKKWLAELKPTKGDRIKFGILTENWNYENDNNNLSCGMFNVDEVDYSGRPLKLSIKALAIPKNIEFTETKRSRKWQSVSMKRLTNDLIQKYNLILVWDTNKDLIIESIEQNDETDSKFLCDTCSKYGFNIKTYSNKIVIYYEGEYENKSSVLKISEEDVENWSGKDTSNDSAYSCVSIKYDDIYGNEKEFNYSISGKANKELKINEKANSYEEAVYIAKSKLREKNKKEKTMSLQMKGNTNLVASNCIDIDGFGNLDGKYFIDKISHEIGGGYKTKLEIHKTLEGDY